MTPVVQRFLVGYVRRLKLYGDDQASMQAFGADVVTELCDTLLENGGQGYISIP